MACVAKVSTKYKIVLQIVRAGDEFCGNASSALIITKKSSYPTRRILSEIVHDHRRRFTARSIRQKALLDVVCIEYAKFSIS